MTRSLSAVILGGIVCGILLLSSGCSSRVTMVYGESDDYRAKCSPAGNTVLRAMVEERGHKTYTVRSLSPANMERLNTLIWCPDDFPNHKKETFTWIEQWLAKGNRTLVYIGRDFSPQAAYWSDIATQQGNSPANRAKWLVAIDEIAGANNSLDAKRRLSRSSLVMPWCRWELRGGRLQTVRSLKGPWSEGVDVQDTNIEVRSAFLPLKASELSTLKNELESAIDKRKSVPPVGVPPPPTAVPLRFGPEDWESQQVELISGVNQEKLPELKTLLTDSDLTPLIGIVDTDSIAGSRIIIVNNNSLFCNHSMLRSAHRDIAAMMMDEFSDGGVGFISGEEDPLIRTDNLDDRQRGFEMLTVWPLNVVAIHAAFLGLATMIAYFPIFGRPRKLRKSSSADFGKHVEAVGALMQKSGDRAYAIEQISEYFKNVRGDTLSPWANMKSEEPNPQSPFRSSSAE